MQALAIPRKRLVSIVGGSLGNLVEWYDWFAYASFAIYFAPVFFPKADPTAQLLSTAAIFAVGFIMRPIGAWVMGRFADTRGRKAGLSLSVALMFSGSLLIAVAPTYAVAGLLGPATLLIARMLQGLSLGGEYGASATYLSEMAPRKNRGFWASFQYMTLIGGQLCAIFVAVVLQGFLTEEQLTAWGWRIPFVIGALLAITAMFMRRHMHETESFEAAKKSGIKRESSLRGLLKYPREVAIVVGLTAGGTAAFYTFTTYMQTFVRQTAGFSDITTTYVIAGSLIFAAALQPIYGLISDKIGRKPMLIFFGVCGTLFTVPLLTTLAGTKSPWMAFLLISAAWIFVAGYTSINAVVKAELFPTAIRATGVAVPYALTVSIFGGTAPAIALFFKQQGHEQWFYYYLAGIIFLSFLVYSTMRDTKHASAMERHE